LKWLLIIGKNDDDGINYGAKTIIYGNRMSLNNRPGRPCYYIDPSEAGEYMSYAHIIRFIGTAIHELIGHGTGKFLAEPTPGKFNFDHDNPPISPVTSQPIKTWYRPKETWGTVFGDLAMTVEECRAFLFAYYLADNKDILAMFGYTHHSVPTADDREHPDTIPVEVFYMANAGKSYITRIFILGSRGSVHFAASRSKNRPGAVIMTG
jgi:dipeptidyl-peptidase-3